MLFHALGAWRITPGFHDLLWNPAFLVPASQLLRGGVRFWHDQLFSKPARHGGVVAWHQDYSYWTRTKPMSHLTCWIALDDATRDNGCLHYVPRSHLWDLLPKPALAGDMDAIQSVLSPQQKEQFKPVAIELKKGMATFHSSTDAARVVREPDRRATPGGGDQRFTRRGAVRVKRAIARRRAANSGRTPDQRPIFSEPFRSEECRWKWLVGVFAI